MTSLLSVSVFGLSSLAPPVSVARTAKPSTLERSTAAHRPRKRRHRQARGYEHLLALLDSAGSGRRSRCRSKRARASLPTQLQGIAPGARPTHARDRDRCLHPMVVFRNSLTLQHSWPRSYLNRCARGITLTIGRHQYPAVRARERGKGQFCVASGSASPAFRRTGTTSARPTVELTLRASGIVSVGSLSLLLAAASRSSKRRPGHEPDAERRVSRPGKSSTSQIQTKPNAPVSPGASAMPYTASLPSGERLHAVVVTPAAGPADCDNCIRAFGSHGDTKPRPLSSQ